MTTHSGATANRSFATYALKQFLAGRRPLRLPSEDEEGRDDQRQVDQRQVDQVCSSGLGRLQVRE
jgi:hypothetical protein